MKEQIVERGRCDRNGDFKEEGQPKNVNYIINSKR